MCRRGAGLRQRRVTLILSLTLTLTLTLTKVSVSDVQFNSSGALAALAAVSTGVVQKVLNSHMQQQCGLSSLQVCGSHQGPMRLGRPLMPELTYYTREGSDHPCGPSCTHS